MARERFLRRITDINTALTLSEVQHLFEELEIHQIELELQNEHLDHARAQLETALSESSELYDFAPVGIVSLDSTGSITKLNLAGANLLGGERVRLLGSKLGLYVAGPDRPAFNALLERANLPGEVQTGEIVLGRNGQTATHAQVSASALPGASGWQLVLVDTTERRDAEEKLRVSEERWKLALESAGDGVWDWSVQTGEVLFSKRFGELFGFSEQEYGHHIEDWSSRIHPDDKARVLADMQAHLSGIAANYASEYRGMCKNGSWKWVLSRGAVVSRTDDSKPLRMIGTHVDITGKKQAEEELLAAARFQQAVFDSLAAQIAVLDRHGTVIQTNAVWRKYALDNGFVESPSSLGGSFLEILDRMTGHDQKTTQAASAGIASVVTGCAPSFQLAQPFFTPLDAHWFMMRVMSVHDISERVVVSLEDVTELKAAELASLTLANTDVLTGALSRRNFLNLAEQELARSTRYELPLMVLMLDLDHFKRINDHHGHAAGDAVLVSFVKTVMGVLRESDLIGRIGGEEFAVLLPNTSLEGGRALALRIIERVRANPVEVAGECIAYTVSVGAGCLSSETSFSSLLGVADAALYRAKNGGRDRLEVAPQ
ncbi:MAG: diguanylate cyclase [Rhodoferax sp.]|nr:diguanylate cyclase [Rhodoferax sp.]MDP3652847.1 diguanylate cyclase [Rhodoferax sp.]